MPISRGARREEEDESPARRAFPSQRWAWVGRDSAERHCQMRVLVARDVEEGNTPSPR